MSFKQYLKENSEHSIGEYEAGSKALIHLKAALNEFHIADKLKSGPYEDWKYFANSVEKIISSDSGEAGLESLLTKMLPSGDY